MKKIVLIAFIITASLILTGAGKPYTLLIYMNGSDLESDFGAATDDLVEMLDSGLDSRNANVIILTGGARRWMNGVIPNNECVVWELVNGHLYEVTSFGRVNMGAKETLRDFIQFGMENFPANKTGLIMWDHGGGSIAGFGHDEKFIDGTLTLLDMDWAFREAGLHEKKLELLGFDACLMASVEMAVIAAQYARVFVASEDLEPTDGWDYRFLGALNDRPNMNGFALGRTIVDTFMDFYGEASDEILTLSVVDLSRVQSVMDAMGNLMYKSAAYLNAQGFRNLATRRARTKTFGEGSPRDNESDMVDIGDMAKQLHDLFPQESTALLRALAQAVVYERNNANVPLYGLSTYYIYGGKSEGESALYTYNALEMDESFTQYLHYFFDALLGSAASEKCEIILRESALWKPETEYVYRLAGISPAQEIDLAYRWPFIFDHMLLRFPINANRKTQFYATPVRVNGRDADLISTENRIMGIRHRDHNVVQKGYDPIRAGDSITFYTLEWDILTDTFQWKRGRTITAQGSLRIEWNTTPANHTLGARFTDMCNNVSYTLFESTAPAAHQRKAFSTSKANCGFAQISAVCPGVSTQTRPLPCVRVYPAARMAAGALKYGSLSYFSTSPCAAA